MDSVDLSVVIVNWNTRSLLRDCLASVYAQATDLHFEVIVVDNASSDGSAEMVEGEFTAARLIRNRENVGFSKAANKAIGSGKGCYVLLLNSDVILLDAALSRMVRFMDQHSRVGVLGPRLTNQRGILEYSCKSFPTPSIALFLNYPLAKIIPPEKAFKSYLLSEWDHGSAREVDWVAGACMLVRRESMEEVGLMDESYFMFAEDVDWCYRMKLSNWRVFYVPSAQVVHVKGASYANDVGGREMRLEAHRSMIRFFQKHYDTTVALRFRVLAVVASVLGILKLLVTCATRLRCQPQTRQEMAHQWAVVHLCLSRQV
jgi:GT2 family glycosyltransferase